MPAVPFGIGGQLVIIELLLMNHLQVGPLGVVHRGDLREEIPGKPTRLAGIVNISCRYISIGSLLFSPDLNEVSGVVVID